MASLKGPISHWSFFSLSVCAFRQIDIFLKMTATDSRNSKNATRCDVVPRDVVMEAVFLVKFLLQGGRSQEFHNSATRQNYNTYTIPRRCHPKITKINKWRAGMSKPVQNLDPNPPTPKFLTCGQMRTAKKSQPKKVSVQDRPPKRYLFLWFNVEKATCAGQPPAPGGPDPSAVWRRGWPRCGRCRQGRLGRS